MTKSAKNVTHCAVQYEKKYAVSAVQYENKKKNAVSAVEYEGLVVPSGPMGPMGIYSPWVDISPRHR